MKKIFVILFLTIPFLGFSQVKNAGCFLRMTSPANEKLEMENDSIKVSFSFDSMNYFCGIELLNKTPEVISVDWDNFIMVMEGKSYPILFDDTRMINKNNPKGKSPVASGTSLKKEIAPVDYIDLDMPLYGKRWIKKRGDQEIGYVIPVVYGNETKFYNCTITVSLK